MARLIDFRIIGPLLVVGIVLAGCGGGGGGDDGGTGNGGGMVATPLVMQTFTTGTPTLTERTGNAGNDVFTIIGDITGGSPALNLGAIDGMAGSDTVELNEGAIVASIAFASTDPTSGSGALHLQNIETITIDGGMVTGAIDASTASAGVVVSLEGGTVGGSLTGSRLDDLFLIDAGAINGIIDGSEGSDTFSIGYPVPGTVGDVVSGAVRDVAFSPLNPDMGDVHLQNIEVIALVAGTVRNVTGSDQNDIFIIGSDITVSGVIDGGDGIDSFSIGSPIVSGVVRDIAFSPSNPAAGDVHLQNIEGIGLIAGEVRNVTGSAQNDFFVIGPDIEVTGMIDGGGGMDTLSLLEGFTPASANLLNDVLTLTRGGGGGSLTFTLESIETYMIDDLTILTPVIETFTTGTPTMAERTGNAGNDIWTIAGDITSNALDVNGLIQAGGGQDEVRLVDGGIVRVLDFGSFLDGSLSLRDVEVITLNGGIVDGFINAEEASAGVTFNLLSGEIGDSSPASSPGFVLGSAFDDTFIIGQNIVINGGIIVTIFDRVSSPLGIINGGGGTDILRLAQGFDVEEAIFIGQVLTLTFSGGRLQFNLIDIEDVDIDGLITTLPSPPLLPRDLDTLGTPDPFFMADSDFDTRVGNILDVTSLGFNNLRILGTRIEGERIDSNFVSLNFAPQDVRQAWLDGWTGSASSVLVADSFGAGERHGYLVMLSVLTSSVVAPLFALEAGLDSAGSNFGDDGGVRAAFILDDMERFADADIRGISFDVINASFGLTPIADPDARERRTVLVEQFGDFYLELTGRGIFLSVTNVMDAVITKAAGNETMDAGFEPNHVAYVRNDNIRSRLLIVGATEGYYDQTNGAPIATYSNFAGSNPDIRARFIVANGDSPLIEAAFINGRPVSTEGRGTSYAAPRVAGYVALLRHKFPNLTARHSADVILETATYQGLRCNSEPEGCQENIYGQGRVDITRALAPVGDMR